MKKIRLMFLGLLMSIIFTSSVNAGSATIGIKTSANQILVGNNITVTVTVSSTEALGSWEYTLNYDSSLVTLKTTTPELHNADVSDNNTTKNKSYTYTFTAKKSGKATFSISSGAVLSWNEEYLSLTKGSKTVTIITQADYQASLSSVNTLSSLAVEGYEISPAFNKGTLNYEVSIPEGTTSIKVLASLTDKKASVNGIGTLEVTNGVNTFKIIVEAENGNQNTYTLVVNVYDSNPIKVTLNNEEYTVVKNKDYLTKPASFNETTITINEMEIPAFYSEIANYYLVGLKNVNGEINLYIYDMEKDSYAFYLELNFNKIAILPLTMPYIIKGYQEYNETINNYVVKTIKYKKDSRYSIIYGKNLETGEESFYEYDTKDEVLIKYNDEVIGELTKQNKKYIYIIIAFGIILGGLFILIIKNLFNKKQK